MVPSADGRTGERQLRLPLSHGLAGAARGGLQRRRPGPSHASGPQGQENRTLRHPVGEEKGEGGGESQSYQLSESNEQVPKRKTKPASPDQLLNKQPESKQSGSQQPSSQQPTTHINEHEFDAVHDVKKLNKAFKGNGTDEVSIVEVLANRTIDQRQQIKQKYKDLFGKDLEKVLESELSGYFRRTSIALLDLPSEFCARELRRATKGIGTDIAVMIEILCTRRNKEIEEIKTVYQTLFGNSLESDVIDDTSGDFKKIVLSLLQASRDEGEDVDKELAEKDAKALYEAGEGRWGTDGITFTEILSKRNYDQLKATFQAYEKLVGKDIEQAMENEVSGDLKKALLTIVRSTRDCAGYFAEVLHKAMKGPGADGDTLIRVIITRAEVSLK
ncbi:annexin A13 [Gracilinanus agilis]|uniref:annexin A13 n=1 Tax=Gracilinanus agilis TaxID=191870 RepID=UPI001CFC94AB|nr:annexin A13 [Gracilinanus agilis]